MKGIGDVIMTLIFGLMGLCVIFIPLGMWKLIEIIIWAWGHVHFH